MVWRTRTREKKQKVKDLLSFAMHTHRAHINRANVMPGPMIVCQRERENRGKRVKKDIKWDFLPHFIDTRHSLRSHNRRKRLVSHTQYNSNWTGFHSIHRIPAATQFYFETMALHHMLGFLQSFVVPKHNTLIWNKQNANGINSMFRPTNFLSSWSFVQNNFLNVYKYDPTCLNMRSHFAVF